MLNESVFEAQVKGIERDKEEMTEYLVQQLESLSDRLLLHADKLKNNRLVGETSFGQTAMEVDKVFAKLKTLEGVLLAMKSVQES